MFLHSFESNLLSHKAQAHKTNIKEQAAMMAGASRLLCLGQKAALEHTTKTTTNGHNNLLCSAPANTSKQVMKRQNFLKPLTPIKPLLIENMFGKKLLMALVKRRRIKISRNHT